MSGQEHRATKRTKRATPRAHDAPGVGVVQARFDRLIARMEELASALARPLSEHRILALVLAYDQSLSSADLAAAVLAFEPSPLFDQFERLRHRAAAYRLLYDLAKLRLLRRNTRDDELVFQLPRRVRTVIRGVLGPLAKHTRGEHGRDRRQASDR